MGDENASNLQTDASRCARHQDAAAAQVRFLQNIIGGARGSKYDYYSSVLFPERIGAE